MFDHSLTVVVFLLILANAACTSECSVACQTPASGFSKGESRFYFPFFFFLPFIFEAGLFLFTSRVIILPFIAAKKETYFVVFWNVKCIPEVLC